MRYRQKPPIVEAFRYAIDKFPYWWAPNNPITPKTGDYVALYSDGTMVVHDAGVFEDMFELIIES